MAMRISPFHFGDHACERDRLIYIVLCAERMVCNERNGSEQKNNQRRYTRYAPSHTSPRRTIYDSFGAVVKSSGLNNHAVRRRLRLIRATSSVGLKGLVT